MTFYVVGFTLNLIFLALLLTSIGVIEGGLELAAWMFMFTTTGFNLVRWAEKFLEHQIVTLARVKLMQVGTPQGPTVH